MRKFEIAKGYEDMNVILPKRGSKHSAGYDFFSLEEYTLHPKEVHLFQTGVKARMNKDEVLLLVVRSSIGIKKGLSLANQVGVIDSDYYGNEKNDGHILIALRNESENDVTITKEERIAQGIFVHYLVTDDDMTKETRIGGIGSTGR